MIWWMIIFFAWIMFLVWVVMLLIDNFRRSDHGGLAKAGWALFIIFAPILGALVYTVTRPESASDHFESYSAYPTRSASSTAEELARLHQLRTNGAISDAEFEQLKQRTIAAS